METRTFNAVTGITARLRSKEDAIDYRFMAEPDLPVITVDADMVESLRSSLPELPDALRERFQVDYGLSHYDANGLVNEPNGAMFFEEVLERVCSKNLSTPGSSTGGSLEAGSKGLKAMYAKQAANWVCNELLGRLREEHKAVGDASTPSATDIADIIVLQNRGTISGKIAKDVLDTLFEELSGKEKSRVRSPATIVEENAWKQLEDTQLIRDVCERVIKAEAEGVDIASLFSENIVERLASGVQEDPQAIWSSIHSMSSKAKKKAKDDKMIEKWREGRGRVLDSFVGKVMALTKAKANPVIVSEELQRSLNRFLHHS
eukprot:gb/GECG01004500.1/.p1 GENE.gb/GECG01004500.1/~~gb/GECG01004500.1/.p1  ORF type:complete len:318 (+),score=54.13 gb/GECG01004500.1/:1-954(+)